MEIALKKDELNMEPRELSLNELDQASGGVVALPVMLGIAVFGSFFCLGAWIRSKLD